MYQSPKCILYVLYILQGSLSHSYPEDTWGFIATCGRGNSTVKHVHIVGIPLYEIVQYFRLIYKRIFKLGYLLSGQGFETAGRSPSLGKRNSDVIDHMNNQFIKKIIAILQPYKFCGEQVSTKDCEKDRTKD